MEEAQPRMSMLVIRMVVQQRRRTDTQPVEGGVGVGVKGRGMLLSLPESCGDDGRKEKSAERLCR